MKHGLAIKFLVILLTGCSLLAAIGGIAGIVAMESATLYVNGLDDLQDQQFTSIAETIADQYATLYAVRNLGNLPYSVRNALFANPMSRADARYWTIKLTLGEQVLVEPAVLNNCAFVQEYTITPEYPIMAETPDKEEDPEQPEQPEDPTDPTSGSIYDDVQIPTGYLYKQTETLWLNNQLESYDLYYYEAPEYTITVYMQQEVLESSSLHLLTALYPYRNSFITIVAVSIVLFAAGMVFLCHQAGRNAKGEIEPVAFNRMPSDLYAVLTIIGIFLLSRLFNQLSLWIADEGPHLGNLSLLGLTLLVIFILGIGYIMSVAAQAKMGDYYLWKHSIIGFLLTWLWRGILLLGKGLRYLFSLVPLLWRWLLLSACLAISLPVFSLLARDGNTLFTILLIVDIGLCLLVFGYGGYAFGILLAGVQKMADGELSHQVQTKYLIGEFRQFGERLNALSGTAMETAQKHLRAERTKADLITNVSHDIKTPLTSIINYIDLLSHAGTEEERQQYLDILSGQSQRLKRLIDDLIDLSKASSGSLQVELTPMDATEAVNQALGEFAERLEAANLTPVFTAPEESVLMTADGKLFWRVISNLLSNAIKYAMPGTRLYVDLSKHEDKVLISLKNVSKEELSSSAEYLLERFVQGDSSRSAEGSGLGLNIAKTLMEVQHGQLHLVADGDLFKVTLVFPVEDCS
jgi:signal transduction histidine kinase